MTGRKIFLNKKNNKLPFFLRNYEIKEVQIIEGDSKPKDSSLFDQNEIYHSEFVECKLSLKPISKILSFDEQKKF